MPFVYIMASRSRILYVGVARDLLVRVARHKEGQEGSFTSRYNVTKLVYFEETPSMISAIAREKQLKRWRRARKIWLIVQTNPDWLDLAEPLLNPEAGRQKKGRK